MQEHTNKQSVALFLQMFVPSFPVLILDIDGSKFEDNFSELFKFVWSKYISRLQLNLHYLKISDL